MATSAVPAMKSSPKYIMFTDYDGTITQQDSNDFLADTYGYGSEARAKDTLAVLENKKQFRDLFKVMMESIPLGRKTCIDHLLANITLDPGFNHYLTWSLAQNIPVVVLSSGIKPFISALLEQLVGPQSLDQIQIVSNDISARQGQDIDAPSGWQVDFHDDSHFGHDKSLEIKKYKEAANLNGASRPYMFYAGDGVSDLSAARETDLLFAKKGEKLIEYCVKEDIPFTVFEDWSDIERVVKDIVEGRVTIAEAAKQGHETYKREFAKDLTR